jgi:hypothetical protein
MVELSCPAIAYDHAEPHLVFGVVVDGRVRYLDKLEPLTDEHRAAAHPARVEEVFRLAGACCQCKNHWTGSQCGLAARIPLLLDAVDGPDEPLAPCPLRHAGDGGCRHWVQEGDRICRSCSHYVYAARVTMPAGRHDAAIADAEWEREWL